MLESAILTDLEAHDFETGKLDPAALAGRAKADGRVPLGSIGAQAVADAVGRTEAWLQSCASAGPAGVQQVRELLLKVARAEPTAATLGLTTAAGAALVLRGDLTSVELGAHRLQVRARPATITTRDRMRAWIHHLFACATGEGATHMVVVGRDDSECYAPLCATEATAALRELAALFRAGHAGPLPFAPESSIAFCEAMHGQAAHDPDILAAAQRAAAAAWGYRDSYNRDECKDTWLFHAFGEEGPMAASCAGAFGEAAVTVFARLLDALPATGDNGQAGGSE